MKYCFSMLQKTLIYIAFWLLFQLFVEINCQMTSFERRRLHTATFIDNKLYISSGRSLDGKDIPVKDFFYLDVSVTFNTQKLSWQNISSNNIVPSHFGAAAVKG